VRHGEHAAPRRRGVRWLCALALLTAAVVAAAIAVDTRPGRRPDGGRDVAGGGHQLAVDAGAQSASPVPQPPTRPPRRGTYVWSQVAPSGEIQVRTWITARTPVEQLYLSTPDPDRTSGPARAVDVVVTNLSGAQLARAANVGAGMRRVRLSAATTGLYLSYTIQAGMDETTPTVAGRKLAQALAMTVTYDGADGVVRHLVTAAPGRVLNVACLHEEAHGPAVPRACGRPTGQGQWTVDLHGTQRQDRLLAQVEASPSGTVTGGA
jgi:hypothetical protein